MNYPQSPSDESPQHPSQPIHDAAYPDTPYQPGFGPQSQNDASKSSHELGSRTSPNSHSPIQSYSQGRALNSGASQAGPSSWPHGAASSSSPANFPDVPPPPYVRNETTPTSHLSPSNWNGPQADGHGESIPLQDYSRPPRPAVSTVTSFAAPVSNQQPMSPYAQGSSISASASTQANKYGPNSSARRRRRRCKICAIVGAVIIIFIIALAIGIGLGVVKSSIRDNNRDGDGP